jgi:2'-5' RNA ligase
VRSFLAVEIPEEVREGLERLAERLRPAHAGWRWVPPSAVHLTIRFLGEVDAAFLREAAPSFRAALRDLRAPRFEVAGLGVFPSARAPRVLWIGVREFGVAGGLDAIFRAVESVSVERGLPPVDRPFHPHLTLARAARDGHAEAPGRSDSPTFGPLVAREVVLFRSDLLPGGARHTPLDRFALAEGP